MRPSEIKARCDSEHFFSRATMRFFGDRMSSYGTRIINGQLYMYRKPSAQVNVYGRSRPAGREFFGAWRVTENADGSVTLSTVGAEEKERVYQRVAG